MTRGQIDTTPHPPTPTKKTTLKNPNLIRVKLKLDGIRLVLTRSVKYLGVLMDETLNCIQQIMQKKDT